MTDLDFLQLDIDLIRLTLALKYDPNQPRDDSGQWSDTGGGGKGVTITTGATYNGVKKYEPSEETKQRITNDFDEATNNFKSRLGISRGDEFISHPGTAIESTEKFATKLNIQEIPQGEDSRLVGGRHIGGRTTFADQVVDGHSVFDKQFEKDRQAIAAGKKPFLANQSTSGLLSHELSHGVEDGFGFTQQMKWSEAYKNAKKNNLLPSKYAELNEHEGFAEVLSHHVESGYTDEITQTAIDLTRQVFHNR